MEKSSWEIVGSKLIADWTLVSCRLLRQNIFLDHLLFAVDQRIDIVGRQFKSVSVRDRIGRACFYAIPAENAARVVDVVHRRVPLSCGDAVRIGIFRCLDVNAIRGAGGSAKEASDALFQAILIAVQHVNAAIARLKMYRFVRVVLRHRLAEHIFERDAEAFHHRGECREHFADWISHNS